MQFLPTSFFVLLRVFNLGLTVSFTAWKVSKYRVFSDPYFPVSKLNTERCGYLSVFSPNAGKYGPEKAQYLDTFDAALLMPTIFRLIP